MRRRFHRWMMVTLSRMFPWRDALVNVKADTLLHWHRKGFRLFWRWKSPPTGRPRLSGNLRDLIRKMAAENAIWGEERIANELKMKLGIRVSPRTVAKYLNNRGLRPVAQSGQHLLQGSGQASVAMGVRVLRTQVRAPQANSVCERFGGTLRRECLDYLIPINERHLKIATKEWVTHYNRGRPHPSRWPAGCGVVKDSVLGGLHHEYRLVNEAA